MSKYIFKRTVSFILILGIILTANFFLLRWLPGSPFEAETALHPETLKSLQEDYGLNEPLILQYKNYMLGVLKGDWGKSYLNQAEDISLVLKESLPASLKLGFLALLICYALGIFLGFLAFSYAYRWPEKMILGFCVLGASLPNFLTAALGVSIFSLQLKWLPVALWGSPSHYVLPLVCLSLRPTAFIAQLTYFSFREHISQGYVQTALSKGLSSTEVFFKHIFRNAVIPILSYSGSLFSGILTGSFVIEKIFSIPGVGTQMTLSVLSRDYPLILACAFVFSFILCFVNYIVDILYPLLDPRIRL